VTELFQTLPPEFIGFVLTLALALLIGLEREEHEPEGLGGIRTFPLIGISGFLLVEAFPSTLLPFAVGFFVLGVLVALTHWAGIRIGEPGITTEVAALLTFILGGIAAAGLYWLAIATGVVTVILLQEKMRLESLAARVPSDELRTLLRFLVLTGVILPAVPNQPFTAFDINPFTIWLVVVAVSGVSYLSYLLQLRWDQGRGLFLSGLLGGAYSSTVTTVVLARQSKRGHHPVTSYVGAIVAATGVMYLRLWILVILFAPPLARELVVLFVTLGLVTIAIGAVLGRLRPRQPDTSTANALQERVSNPLEISSAFTFAGIFLGVMIVTRMVADRFGGTGVLVLAAVMGAADVDPFILGLTQYAGGGVALDIAALAVVIAAAANNVMKGVYAMIFGAPRVGYLALVFLTALGAASLAAYLVF
jgi:uncharacterized membrane protein (DUF4010 family)